MRVENIGKATLYLGDCLQVLPTLGPVDAAINDPPYGMGYRSNHNSGRHGAGAEMVRLDGDFDPTEGDSVPFDPAPWLGFPKVVLWGANYFCDQLARGHAWLIWDKLAGKASFPSGADAEMAWTNWKGPTRVFEHLWRGIMRAGEENIVHSAKHHSHQKPVALMAWCIAQCKLVPNSTILDGYMGSGTTGVAAVRAGHRFIGCEIVPKHFETACTRIEEAQRQADMFASIPA